MEHNIKWKRRLGQKEAEKKGRLRQNVEKGKRRQEITSNGKNAEKDETSKRRKYRT